MPLMVRGSADDRSQERTSPILQRARTLSGDRPGLAGAALLGEFGDDRPVLSARYDIN